MSGAVALSLIVSAESREPSQEDSFVPAAHVICLVQLPLHSGVVYIGGGVHNEVLRVLPVCAA